jgi:type II restriction enzyme
MNDAHAKAAIDSLIKKSRVHLYKPIQISEILYRDRVIGDINLLELETYRSPSKQWRDDFCYRFLGRKCTSSSRFQDDLFNDTAIPINILSHLGNINREKNGIVEAYIYRQFQSRMSQMSTGLEYCIRNDEKKFKLQEFLDLFWHEAGLRRSIDKIYEIVVYSLFSALVDAIGVTVEVSIDNDKNEILRDFDDFAKLVLGLTAEHNSFKLNAKIHRVGVTNAADRGLDMFANFGLIIQIKHLSLTEELAEGIANSVTGDRIVIVCKDSEEKLIISLLTQIGWKSRIQSIITESNLLIWYEKALRGKYSKEIGSILLDNLKKEIQLEFPTTNNKDFLSFMEDRAYIKLNDHFWQ